MSTKPEGKDLSKAPNARARQGLGSAVLPVIQRAKDSRQIVMVTHNASLSVFCDVEQTIHAEFDRGDQFALPPASGAIESLELNRSCSMSLRGRRWRLTTGMANTSN